MNLVGSPGDSQFARKKFAKNDARDEEETPAASSSRVNCARAITAEISAAFAANLQRATSLKIVVACATRTDYRGDNRRQLICFNVSSR